MNRRLWGSLSIGFASVFISVGCGGGGSSAPHVTPVLATAMPSAGAASNAKTATASFSIRVPAQVQMTSARTREYVAATTASFIISVAQNDIVKEKVTETVGAPACTANPDKSLSCFYTVTGVPVGTDVLQVQAFDTASKLLSEGTQANASIVMDQANQVTITLLGDVAKVVMSLASPIPACSPTSEPLTVIAEDADGNMITGTFDNPFVLAASIPTAFPSPGASATPNSSISPASYPAASATSTPLLTYDGDSPGGSTITATVNGTTVGTYGFAPKPTICGEYPVVGEQVQGTLTTGPGPRGIVTAPDNYLYETNYSLGTIGRVTSTLGTGGTATGTNVPLPLTNASIDAVTDLEIYPKPEEIVVGPGDGNLWITDEINGIDTISYTNPTMQNSYTQDTAAGEQAGEEPEAIVDGPGSELYFTNGLANQIGAVSAAGTFSIFALTTPAPGPTAIPKSVASPNPNASATALPTVAPNPGPKGMILGPGGNLYFAEMRSSKIGVIAPSAITAPAPGNAQTEYAVTPGSEPYFLTIGPGGLLWFTEFHGSIGSISTSGTGLQEFRIAGHPAPVQIVYGADGNVYFTDAGNNAIGRITPSGSITEYAVPTLSSGLFGITLGPDKNAWFTESAGGNVGYLGY